MPRELLRIFDAGDAAASATPGASRAALRRFRLHVACALGLLLALLPAGARAFDSPGRPPAAAPLLPVEHFFRKPQMASLSLSPDGRRLAWLAPWKDRMNVYVKRIGGGKARRITSVTDRDVLGYLFAKDDTIVFLRDSGGDENHHLFAVGVDGGEARDLTPFPGVKASVLDRLEDVPDKILVLMNRRDPKVFDVYRLTLGTGALEPVAENPGNVVGWLTDNDGKVRAAEAARGLDTVLLYRDTENDPFRPVLTTDFHTTVSPVAFTFDNRRLFVQSNLGRDRIAAAELDPATGKEVRVLFEHPEVDVTGMLISRHRKVADGAQYVTDKIGYAFFDRKREALQRFLDRRFPGKVAAVVGGSRDERRLLVHVASDRTPGRYYLLDRGWRRLRKVAELAPWIRPERMARMKPIAYASRDGVTIHGYLTLPPGVAPKNLPVVVHPHGGPWARDVWGYSPRVQFLASRGYAVLQMNFRGSTSYGRKFMESGFRQMGKGVMQNDVTDGVRWLTGQGVADARRVAIFGASYGGYATLAGVTFTPDLYAAGVSFVGPSNLFTFLGSIPPYWEPERKEIQEKWGDPETDKEFLESVSPYFHADRIKAPLFIAHGANDPRVKKAESDQIVRALRARGVSVPYMVKANEGHGYANQENVFDFYRALEAFLALHLGGRSMTAPDFLLPLEKAE